MIAAATERERVGPYQLIKAIGAGGSARIDLARIEKAFGFQRHVVIKRPLEHLRGDPKAAASLQREARLGAQLRHPNLTSILDAGVHDGYDYLVLEYVHGGSLRTLMQTDSPTTMCEVPLAVAIAIAGDIARGLHAAHELVDEGGAPLGLVHRDVSPGNILIGLDGAVKLADFGIAKETRVQTLSGSMHGTVTYMAPEQCRGHAFDRRADLFSLGVILYELLTGTRLFWADNDVASLHRVLSGDVPRPRKVKPSITPALEDIVMTAIAQDPDRRFATARQLAEVLDQHAGEVGEVLGARWIARWVHDQIGPREVPWIGAATVPMPAVGDVITAALAAEPSLVDIIDAVPADEVPPELTFGPTIPGSIEDSDTQPHRDPPVRRRKTIALAIALGLASGVVGTVLVTSGGSAPAIESAPPSTEPKPPVDPKPNPAKATEAPAVAEPDPVHVVHDSPDVVTQPAVTPTPSRRRRPASPSTVPPNGKTDGSAAVVVSEPPPEPVTVQTRPPPKPLTGSGSQRVKVEWNPTILLPTDSGSGKHK